MCAIDLFTLLPLPFRIEIYCRVVIIGHINGVNADIQILGLQFCVNNLAFLTASLNLSLSV